MTKRALIYARVSLDLTGEGRSVERQLDACRALCQLRGWTVVEELQDNSISASGDKHRPAWEKVLAAVEAGAIDYVVAWHLDRMTRSMLDLEKLILLLEKRGVGIATASGDIDLTTDVGRMVARILAAVARAEVERKAARQRLSNAQRAASGKPWTGGRRPFGYTADQLSIVDDEAAAIVWAADALLHDDISMEEVAREWGRRGFTSSASRGRAPWTGRGVRTVLMSPRYAGIRAYLGEEIGPAEWPPILSEDTHMALRSKLSESVGTRSWGGPRARNLLTGIARCDVCDKPVSATRIGTPPRSVYACPHRHLSPPRERADLTAAGAMVALLSTETFLASLVDQDDDRAEALRAELDTLHRRSKILAAGLADGSVDETTFLEVAGTLRQRIKVREDELTAATTGSVLTGLRVGLPEVARQWSSLSLERQRTIIDAFLEVRFLRKARVNLPWSPDEHMAVERKKAPTPVKGEGLSR